LDFEELQKGISAAAGSMPKSSHRANGHIQNFFYERYFMHRDSK
jgi:hypothetical protein